MEISIYNLIYSSYYFGVIQALRSLVPATVNMRQSSGAYGS